MSAGSKSSSVFQLWVDEANTAYDTMEAELISQISKMRTMGISEEEIFARLSKSLQEGMDAFQSLNGALGSGLDDMLGSTSQIASNDFEDTEMLVWTLDPTAQEHCDDCVANSESEAMTFVEWESLGIPGAGNTECGEYCKCSLDPA